VFIEIPQDMDRFVTNGAQPNHIQNPAVVLVMTVNTLGFFTTPLAMAWLGYLPVAYGVVYRISGPILFRRACPIGVKVFDALTVAAPFVVFSVVVSVGCAVPSDVGPVARLTDVEVSVRHHRVPVKLIERKDRAALLTLFRLHGRALLSVVVENSTMPF
jgi:hypothetical protein